MTKEFERFIAAQTELNRQITQTLDKMSEAVEALKEGAVRNENLSSRVEKHGDRLNTVEDELIRMENIAEFVKGARRLMWTVMLSVILATGALVWSQSKRPVPLTKSDVSQILKALKRDQPVLP